MVRASLRDHSSSDRRISFSAAATTGLESLGFPAADAAAHAGRRSRDQQSLSYASQPASVEAHGEKFWPSDLLAFWPSDLLTF